MSPTPLAEKGERMMSRPKPIGLGIVGCGIAASTLHWPALSRLRGDFAVVSVCNHTREKAIRLSGTIGEAYGREIPYALDYRELLASPEVAAVSIILPVEQNREVCTAAAKAGKHILVEKPIAESEESARELLHLEEQHPELVTMVAENFLYRSVFDTLADVLRSGAIGIPTFVEWRAWQRIDPATNPYAKTQWRVHHCYEGGFVTDAGIHNIAALGNVFGDLVPAGSVSASVDQSIGRTDTLVFLFRTQGKDHIPPLSGVLSVAFSACGAKEDRLTVLGSRGSAVVDGSTLTIRGTSSDEPQAIYEHPDDDGYVEEYRAFHRAITTGTRPKSTFALAYRDLATILGALRLGQASRCSP